MAERSLLRLQGPSAQMRSLQTGRAVAQTLVVSSWNAYVESRQRQSSVAVFSLIDIARNDIGFGSDTALAGRKIENRSGFRIYLTTILSKSSPAGTAESAQDAVLGFHFSVRSVAGTTQVPTLSWGNLETPTPGLIVGVRPSSHTDSRVPRAGYGPSRPIRHLLSAYWRTLSPAGPSHCA